MLFLLLNLLHIEVGLAEILRGLELLRLLDVEVVEHLVIGSGKVTRRLTCQPTGCHVCYLGCRNEVVHLLRDCGRYLLVIDGDRA